MQQEMSLDEVNRHYLDRIVSLSETRPVEAGEDIYSSGGIKLLSKGAQICPDAQERLILHKLRRPLELSIAVSDPINQDWLAQAADRVIEETPGLKPIFGWVDLTRWIDALALNGATHTMIPLSSAQENGGLQHALRVTLVALAVGNELGLKDSEMQNLAMAGLLHDMGEYYLAPECLDRKQQLSLESWRHVSVHPLIGHKLATEICGLHPQVAQAILEHHERGDGSGYPKGRKADELSRPGYILAVAELVASIAEVANYPLIRADLALRLGRDEFPQEVVNIINKAVGKKEGEPPQTGHTDEEMHELFLRFAQVLETIEELRQANGRSADERKLFERIVERFHHVQRSFFLSGLDQCAQVSIFSSAEEADLPWLRFEADLIVHEIRWRLRDLVRDLSLRACLLSPATNDWLTPLLVALVGADLDDSVLQVR